MSEDSCFTPSLTHYASIEIETDQGSLPVYFSFKVDRVKDNQVEIGRISPPEIEELLLSKKSTKLLLKKNKKSTNM